MTVPKSGGKSKTRRKRPVKKTGNIDPDIWQLRLYVAGNTPKSLSAIQNLRAVCEKHLKDKYQIEVVDLLEKPQLAGGDQILAVPTLVRRLPSPLKRIIGDLSDTERVLVGLDVRRTLPKVA